MSHYLGKFLLRKALGSPFYICHFSCMVILDSIFRRVHESYAWVLHNVIEVIPPLLVFQLLQFDHNRLGYAIYHFHLWSEACEHVANPFFGIQRLTHMQWLYRKPLCSRNHAWIVQIWIWRLLSRSPDDLEQFVQVKAHF